MKRTLCKIKYCLNTKKAWKAVMNGKGYRCYEYIQKDNNYKGKFVYHENEVVDKELLKNLSTKQKYFNSTIIKWDPSYYQLDDKTEEAFAEIHVYPNIVNLAGECAVFAFLPDGTELKESDL